jgi:hypothetical protein
MEIPEENGFSSSLQVWENHRSTPNITQPRSFITAIQLCLSTAGKYSHTNRFAFFDYKHLVKQQSEIHIAHKSKK